MRIFGALRIKNEARWISRVIGAILPICERVVILDDHSDDGTPELCASLGAKVYRSTFEGIHEARDKDHLLALLAQNGAKSGDWVLMIDGDELLADPDVLVKGLESARMMAYSLPILYLWDSESRIRVDGVYRGFRRPSVFRLVDEPLTFKRTDFGGNFHCSSVPAYYISCGCAHMIPARLLHFGYMHKEDRVRKYEWYNSVDPNNIVEDGYRHMVTGDLFPAGSKFRWGGPLKLEALNA